MSLIEGFPGHPMIEAVGWAHLHFIWQGMLIAALTANLMWLIRRCSAEVRYLVMCAAMLCMLASPIITTVVLMTSNPGRHGLSLIAANQSMTDGGGINLSPDAALSAPSSYHWSERLSGWITQELAWLVSIWLAGVLLLSLRLLFGSVSAQRFKIRETRPVAGRWQEMFGTLCARLGVMRPVSLLESSLVRVPTVVGWLRPVILLPACALTGLAPQQLEAVIA